MQGIAEMFAELDGYGRYDEALEAFARSVDFQRRRDAVERTRLWRKMNPEKFRAQSRRNWKRWAARNPEKAKAVHAENKRRARERNPEKFRAMWRRNTAAYRARKKAAAEQARTNRAA